VKCSAACAHGARGARTLDDMARKPRCFGEGIYHLSSDGSDIRQLFLSGEDRLEFLKLLATTCERFEVPLISYVLMGNHYHAVVRTPDDRVSEALQFLHTGYSRNHNRRNARSAHLFRAHPFAREIEGNDDFLTVILYLALNPVAAGFVRHPLDWPWSSARAHAGVDASMIPLDELLLRGALDDAPDWRSRYVALINTSAEGPSPRDLPHSRHAEAASRIRGRTCTPATMPG
jgi:REP element-mobilizing transposase RayT